MLYNDLYDSDLVLSLDSISNINKLDGKRVLITGSRGLIGSAIVDLLLKYNSLSNSKISIYLADRDENKVIERFKKFINGKDYFILNYDACNPIKFNVNVDFIIHAAGICSPLSYINEPVETMLGNLFGINNLLKYGVEHNVDRVLYVSSSEVYGKVNSFNPLLESDTGFVDLLDVRSCYPSAKRASESLCISYSKEYGIDTVIVRPGHIYGPTSSYNDKRAAAEFVRTAINGNDIVMKSAGNQIRSYCYSLDCASAILTLLINGESCNAYNISNNDSVCSIREFAEKVANICNKKLLFDVPTDIEKISFNKMDNASLNSQKLYSLGWKPIFDIDKGLQHYVEIMKNL